MSAAKMMKPARDLKPGDIFFAAGARAVVVYSELDETQRVRLLYALIGTRERDCELSSTNQAPGAQFTVELPAGLTPVQEAAETLLGYARLYLDQAAQRNVDCVELRALLDELEPPKPPTLEEAIAVLRELTGPLSLQSQYEKVREDARKLLARVPK